MKSRPFLLLFVLPYGAVLLLFFTLSSLNRTFLRQRTEQLAGEQLRTSAEILMVGVRDLLEEGVPSGRLLQGYARTEGLHFAAVLDAGMNVLDWSSRFEGYLPFSRADAPEERGWTTDSPAGRIYNVFLPFATREGTGYHLYLGYSLDALDEALARSRANFWLVFAVLSMAGLVLFRGVYGLHRQTLARAEEAVSERQEKERYREISGFTAGVAHEIKNPLNSLALLCEMVSRKAPPDLAEEAAGGRREVQKIARIIDQLSSALKPMTLRPEPVTAGDIVRDAAAAASAEASVRNIELRTGGGPNPLLRADRGLLAQAVFNVVRNAVEATGSGGAVEIRTEKRKGRGRIVVEDAGPGIPEEDLELVFEPFSTTKPGGLGVGLFLARKIVEAHEGTIRAERREGGGSRFTMDLPGGSE